MNTEKSFLSKEDIEILELCKKEKLSVSKVQYSRGHDGDCMNADLKVGTKKTGFIFDDSWGGGYDYKGKDIYVFLEKLDKIISSLSSIKLNDEDIIPYTRDTIVYLLIEDFELRKLCKKKSVVLVKDKENSIEKTFQYNAVFDVNMEKHIHNDMKQDKPFQYEIVNKRFLI